MAEFYKKKLKNGLTVLFEKRSLPVVSISASVNMGAAFENEKNKGMSHFMEHLMFKGTNSRSQEEIAREIEKKGGVLNAYTSEEITSYWNKLPSRHIFTGISIASDLILNPKFDAVEFEKEKKVIVEEIKMYHDSPGRHVYDKIKEMLYKKPFGMSIAGTEQIINGMTRQGIVDSFESIYTSDSMVLAVVGDADFDEICRQAEKIYPKKTRKILEHNPIKQNSQQTEKRSGIDQAHFIFGFHAPALKDKQRYTYEVAGAYLFGGMSSRLFQEIREKRGLAYAVKGDLDLGKEYGYSAIYVGTMPDKIKKIKDIILKEIRELKNLNQLEFNECKEQLIGERKVVEEDSSSAMNMLLVEEFAGNAEEHYKYEERIKAVKLSNVKNISKLKAYSTFSLIPK
ncbi:hypothetical protein COV15_02785 [Candidatus Woesearchaeota archaeon CG10_big_fil_rev_8_21_14_0_10_34_12]|nr:MAG: hypothetical protein COV15_02785 [Candidatus Woesearchaeota archaeon CG10_big_fil_rev_8_21_14_0_10_34_12]